MSCQDHLLGQNLDHWPKNWLLAGSTYMDSVWKCSRLPWTYGRIVQLRWFSHLTYLKMVNVLFLILTPKKAGPLSHLLGIPWTYWWCQLTQAKCTSGCKAKTQHTPPNKIIWEYLQMLIPLLDIFCHWSQPICFWLSNKGQSSFSLSNTRVSCRILQYSLNLTCLGHPNEEGNQIHPIFSRFYLLAIYIVHF